MTTAWVMTVGLALLVVPLAITGVPHLDGETVVWLAIGGVGEFVGLMLTFRAVGHGDVGVVGPIISAEGGITATIAIIAGEPVTFAQGLSLVAVVLGVMLTARSDDDADAEGRLVRSDDDAQADDRPTCSDDDAEIEDRSARSPDPRSPALLAVEAAVSFGFGLYGIARAGTKVPLVWAVMPPRLIAVVALAIPLAARGSLRLTRTTAPILFAAGVCDLLGYFSYAWGARHDIGITAVLATLSGAVSVALGRVLFSERLSTVQLAGAATIMVGIAALSALTA